MEGEHEIGLGLTIKDTVEIDTTPEGDGPEVSVKAELFEGRYVCTEAVVRCHRATGLTSRTLRDVAVGYYVQWAAETSNSRVGEKLVERAAEAKQSGSRVTDDLLEVVAATYRFGYAVSGNPTAKIMEVFGIERPRAAKWVSHCRERGFLGTTEMGRPGGVETAPTATESATAMVVDPGEED